MARGKAPELLEELNSKCKQPQGVPPPECRSRSYDFEWKPEPSKIGVSGGLPYVRVSKRCVIGLGFFACALGTLPAADGDLFKDMDDPDRPRSSVPGQP